MRRYKEDVVLIEPTYIAVRERIEETGHAVNRERTRGEVPTYRMRALWFRGPTLESVLALSNATWEEARATPTYRTWPWGVGVLGCCWWQAPNRGFHVRIVGEDIRSEGARNLRKESRPWGLSLVATGKAAAVTFVYPELWLSVPMMGPNGFERITRLELVSNPLDDALWAIRADWLFEHDDIEGGNYAARAYETAKMLRERYF